MSRTNEKRTTLQEFEDATIKVNYFLVEHDKLTPCNQLVPLPGGWIHCKARVDLLEFTEHFEALDTTKDFKTFQLYINDEFIGELIDVQEEDTVNAKLIKCSVVVGVG